jgi:hypothetical protein
VPPPLQLLLDHLLDRGLERYVADARSNGKSWRQISLDIHDQVGVDVTLETLRMWFPQYRDVRTGAA